jgi:hypothetical protein
MRALNPTIEISSKANTLLANSDILVSGSNERTDKLTTGPGFTISGNVVSWMKVRT